MLDKDTLASVAQQMMAGNSVEVAGKVSQVRRTSANRLRTVAFEHDGRQYQAIEQNPDKPSRWGEMARHGRQVVQFKDVELNKFVAVSVDGKVQIYGSRPSSARKE